MTELHVLAESHEGPGLRYRVRGLLGNRALAVAIETALHALPGVRVRASSASGRVRAGLGGGAGARDVERALARVVSEWSGVGAVTARAVPAARSPGARDGTRAPRPVDARAQAASAARPPARSAGAGPSSRGEGGGAGVNAAHATGERALMAQLKSSQQGLSEAQARERLARDGPNELDDLTGRGDLEILLEQFRSVPVALLAGSGVLSLATRAVVDAAAIGAVLAANAGIGFVTERKAERTVASLRKLAPISATVLRDGEPAIVPAARVVIGDVLLLRPGEQIAADARVIESHRLSANEAALTGESLPVRKEPSDALARDAPIGERRNIVHMGTVVSGGMGRAVVVATGALHRAGCDPRPRARRRDAAHPAPDRTRRARAQARDRLGAAVRRACSDWAVVRGRPLVPLMRTVGVAGRGGDSRGPAGGGDQPSRVGHPVAAGAPGLRAQPRRGREPRARSTSCASTRPARSPRTGCAS